MRISYYVQHDTQKYTTLYVGYDYSKRRNWFTQSTQPDAPKGMNLRLALTKAYSLHEAIVNEVCNCLQALKECKIVYKIKNCEGFTWFAWFQASTAVYMTPSLFWDVTLRRLVIVTHASGQNIGPIFKGPKTDWPLKIIPIGCPEMSVTNYQSTHHNIREEWRSRLLDLFVYLEFI